MLIEITRDCVVATGQNAVKGEVIDVSEDKARELAYANAATEAPEGAKVGKPKVGEPEVVAPEAVEPEVIAPEITEPGGAEVDTEAATPEVEAPAAEVVAPEVVEPEVVEPEVVAPLDDLLHEAKQHVSVDCPFVRLIQNHN